MGLRSEVINYGSSRVESTSNGFVKEPDGSFGPVHKHWPTVVIESGLSESETKLANDARGWLEAPGSETQIVLTINIDRTSPTITFHRWQLDSVEMRRITRSHCHLGVVVEEVVATRQRNVTEVTGDITLPFSRVTARAPRNAAHTTEHDIILTKVALTEICEKTWPEVLSHGVDG
ncbi:uncharacterized protein GIQ15_02631 [Arthroderma uncinatum]|uniref:uncharacterized protein n=1 Tax=Arthroderma uncinatum TaxID=74035 RepID=UPI00144AC7CC|nr:uncharacterized protein GIQ15_02631 [Arthroderma uncinatum]KAF3483307.1 hypothetical protein GIQ15_02631 [Arthroderma uncinatum]